MRCSTVKKYSKPDMSLSDHASHEQQRRTVANHAISYIFGAACTCSDQAAKATLLPSLRELATDGPALGALRDSAFSLFFDAFFAKTASLAFA